MLFENRTIKGIDNKRFSFYFEEDGEKLKLMSKDGKMICSMYKNEVARETLEKGALMMDAIGESDVTAFSAYMDANIVYSNIVEKSKIKNFVFISEENARYMLDDNEHYIKDTKNFYSNKNMQLKWNFISLHPVCLEIDDEKNEFKYRSLESISDEVRIQMKKYKIDNNYLCYYTFENSAEKFLGKYLKAHRLNYDKALKEIEKGRKKSHWIWYIFPQVLGLGKSEKSNYYAIKSKHEAISYINNRILYKHLMEISYCLLYLRKENILDIMDEIDAMKLKSSMTLFSIVDERNDVYDRILNKYFNGEKDQFTIDFLNDEEEIYIKNDILNNFKTRINEFNLKINDIFYKNGICFELIDCIKEYAGFVIEDDPQDIFWSESSRSIFALIILSYLVSEIKISMNGLIEKTKNVDVARKIIIENINRFSNFPETKEFLQVIKLVDSDKTFRSVIDIIHKSLCQWGRRFCQWGRRFWQ